MQFSKKKILKTLRLMMTSNIVVNCMEKKRTMKVRKKNI